MNAVQGAGAEDVPSVIPAVELTGSRGEKLTTLDARIAYLEQIRRRLTGVTDAPRGGFEGPSRFINEPSWPWFTAGVGVGVLFVILLTEESLRCFALISFVGTFSC